MAIPAAHDTDRTLALARDMNACTALLAREIGRALTAHDVTWPQAMSLILLAEQDEPVNATWLVQEMGLGRTAMTAVVDRLERRGWLERRPHLRDRRVSELALTEAGRRLAAHVTLDLSKALTQVMTGTAALPLLDAVSGALADT